MMQSLYSAVTGMNVHQTAMDVIGNNIANVNTTGYKSTSATFKELFNQTLTEATSAQDNVGGTNAIQTGSGVALASTNIDMTSGSIEFTGNSTDVAIDGDGFFIVSDGTQNYYTRSGSFSFDEDGYLTYGSNGYYVQGWLANEDGLISTNSQNTEKILPDINMSPSATTGFDFSGNIDSSNLNTLDLGSSKILVENTAGDTDNVSIELTKTAYNSYEYTLTAEDSSSDFSVNGTNTGNTISGTFVLNNDGEVISMTANGEDLFSYDLALDVTGTGSIDLENHTTTFDINSESIFSDAITTEEITAEFEFESSATISADVYDTQGNSHTVIMDLLKYDDNTWGIDTSDLEVTDGSSISISGDLVLEFDDDGNMSSGDTIELSFLPDGLSNTQTISIDLSGITQYSDDTDISTANNDGYSAGTLESISFSDSGVMVGSYDNGYSKSLGQLAIGNFSNTGGLEKVGETLFAESSNSGDVVISSAGTGGTGTVQASSLEASNVDLAQQFSDMIKVQRGYQANSTVITTSDEMLQTLINIKR